MFDSSPATDPQQARKASSQPAGNPTTHSNQPSSAASVPIAGAGPAETASPSKALKRTPLYDVHVALGAKMVSFAGFEMPVQYPTGITAEHKAVREKAGLFDVSHMGEFIVRGPRLSRLSRRRSRANGRERLKHR